MTDVLSILKSEAAQDLFRRHSLAAVYLFGSHAAGRADADSDIDVAVLFASEGSPTQRFRQATALQLDLKPLLRAPTDLIDIVPLDDASPLVAFEAVIRGKEVYARDDDERIRYELRVRHRYEDYRHILQFFTQALKEELGVA